MFLVPISFQNTLIQQSPVVSYFVFSVVVICGVYFGIQLKLTPEYLEMKRYEAISKMAKVYYGPSIPNFMVELPQSLTTATVATNTNSDASSNTPASVGSKEQLPPLTSDTQKT